MEIGRDIALFLQDRLAEGIEEGGEHHHLRGMGGRLHLCVLLGEVAPDVRGLLCGGDGLGKPRHEVTEHPAVVQLLEAAGRLAGGQHLVHLLHQPGRRALGDEMGVGPHGHGHPRIQLQVQTLLEFHGADDPHRILDEPPVGIADGVESPGLDVLKASHVVVDLPPIDVVHERVDGEVPPDGVVRRAAEQVLRRVTIRYVVLAGGAPSKGGHLDDLALLEQQMGQAEPPPDEPAVSKQPLHLPGKGGGGHVEVLGTHPEENVPHASPHQVRIVSKTGETANHLGRIEIDHLFRNRMARHLVLAGDVRGGRCEERRLLCPAIHSVEFFVREILTVPL